jgi:2,4-dienoyl-CoA reductase (NADPH2)
VASYIDILTGKVVAGRRVAIIGAGGIGFDVADYLTHAHHDSSPRVSSPSDNGKSILSPKVDKAAVNTFLQTWGIDSDIGAPGGLLQSASPPESARQVYLLQRKSGKLGGGLGKTTGMWHVVVLLFAGTLSHQELYREYINTCTIGWIHRTTMKMRKVTELSGCKYVEVNDSGLVIEQGGARKVIDVSCEYC